ncbi:MAG: SRPBCC domain-containing protein [Bacteroidota bacterium]
MRYIKKEIIIDREITVVFDALISPSQICKWWFAKTAIVLPETGGFYAAAWGDSEDQPDYISMATIKVFERPYRLTLVYEKYYSKDGQLPFDATLDAAFTLEDLNGQTKLTVVQSGFPITLSADAFYQGCVKGWEDTFASLKKVLEGK